jgi:hypothetical protein
VQQDQGPHDDQIEQSDQNGSTADVLGTLGESVVVERDSVYRGFDRRVEQLDNENEQYASNHQRSAQHVVFE